jgi:hypothetical protein
LSQVFDLEHDGHCGLKLDDLARVKTELLVIVEHSVHVLNPNGIDWPIEDDPFTISGLRFSAISNLDGKHTIAPLS